MGESDSTPATGSDREEPRFEQGYRWEGDDPERLAEVVEAALDYRGNVTLKLGTGEEVEGFLFNRDRQAREPSLDLFPADGSPRRRIPYAAIAAVAFTGRDAASGKSWESWVRKYEAKKQAEARGEKVENIGLFPEPLE